tara:strand:+ start:607 stop:1572 length:966 start_codon:yes stop_codon:yes gene_type:complete
MTEIKHQYNREPQEVLSVLPRVYKIGETVGATYRFDMKDSAGNNTGKQWSFWTEPCEVAFEDFRGNHHPSCQNYPCEGPITDSKRKLSFNMGYMSEGMKQLVDNDHGAGTAAAMISSQKKMHDTLEKQLAYVLEEIHRQSLDKSTAELMKSEGVTDGVVATMQKEMKKKHNRDKTVFMSTAKGCSWEPNDNGITTVFNNWVRTFAGTRNDKTPYYPSILDKSGDLNTDVTPDGSAYTLEDGNWTYDHNKDPHVVKRGQLVKLQLTPCFYATKNGAKGFRFKIQRLKVLKQSPYGTKRAAEEEWGADSDDDLSSYAKQARTE